MENNENKIITNNLIWKFAGKNKYPILLYRDEENIVIRDAVSSFEFSGDKKADLVLINNKTQFTRNNYNILPDEEYDMDFIARLGYDRKVLYHIYLIGMLLSDNGILTRTKLNNGSINANGFALFGEHLSLLLEKEADKIRNDTFEKVKEEDNRLVNKITNFFTKKSKFDKYKNKRIFIDINKPCLEAIHGSIYTFNKNNIETIGYLSRLTLIVSIHPDKQYLQTD